MEPSIMEDSPNWLLSKLSRLAVICLSGLLALSGCEMQGNETEATLIEAVCRPQDVPEDFCGVVRAVTADALVVESEDSEKTIMTTGYDYPPKEEIVQAMIEDIAPGDVIRASYYRDKEQLFLDRLSKIEEGSSQLSLDRSADN